MRWYTLTNLTDELMYQARRLPSLYSIVHNWILCMSTISLYGLRTQELVLAVLVILSMQDE